MTSIQEIFHYLELNELSYVVLIVMLFILPRLFMSFGLPISLGAFFLGFASSNYLYIYANDKIIPIFATLGISSLFLYAGLDVDFGDLRKNGRLLTEHIIVKALLTTAFAFGIQYAFGYPLKVSALISLALLTPSTGFIFDNLSSSNLTEEQMTWVKSKAIAAEILALLLLLLFQSNSPAETVMSFSIILALLLILPFFFHWIEKRKIIKSPGSDFSLLLLLAVAAGTLTKKLGAYYLVGAFLVGFTVNFYEQVIAKDPRREFEYATKFFAGFFMPFYFFYAGMKLDSSIFTFQAIAIGLAMVIIVLPIRLFSVVIHRKISLKEKTMEGLPISISLLPTLVFGIVLVEIIRATNYVSANFIGALIVYTIFATLLPSFFLRFVLKRNDLVNVSSPTLTPRDKSIFFDPRI